MEGVDAEGDTQTVRARVPMSEMLTYGSTLRSITQGRGSFHMEMSHYEEVPRSLQLYGTHPDVVGEAVKRLTGEGRVDHVDLNFGCPVPKVTRKGGGGALPWKRGLLGDRKSVV